MANESITIYKLIILYFLKKTSIPLPQTVISDYIVSHGYTNYFTLQNALGELLNADFIAEDETYHLSYYTLTEAGQRNTGSLRHASFPLKSVLRLMLIWLNIRLRSSMRLLLSVITTRQTTELIWLPAV